MNWKIKESQRGYRGGRDIHLGRLEFLRVVEESEDPAAAAALEDAVLLEGMAERKERFFLGRRWWRETEEIERRRLTKWRKTGRSRRGQRRRLKKSHSFYV